MIFLLKIRRKTSYSFTENFNQLVFRKTIKTLYVKASSLVEYAKNIDNTVKKQKVWLQWNKNTKP